MPDPTEAPIRRLMFELYVEHRRRRTVARLLNEAGHRTRGGIKFSDTSVERLIRDPIAKGQRRMNYSRSTGQGRHWVLKPEADWIHMPAPVIVPEELWTQANAIMDAQRMSGKRIARRTVHLFAGLVFCACDGPMYVPSNSPKYICRKCRTKVPAADLEAVFREQLRVVSVSPDEVAAFLAEGNAQLAAKRELLTTLQAEARRVAEKMAETHRLYLDKQVPLENFGALYNPLAERRKQLDDEIPRLQAEIDFQAIQELSRDEVFSQAKALYERWPELPPEDKRAILETAVRRVRVGNAEIEFDLAYRPPASLEVLATDQHNFNCSSPRSGGSARAA